MGITWKVKRWHLIAFKYIYIYIISFSLGIATPFLLSYDHPFVSLPIFISFSFLYLVPFHLLRSPAISNWATQFPSFASHEKFLDCASAGLLNHFAYSVRCSIVNTIWVDYTVPSSNERIRYAIGISIDYSVATMYINGQYRAVRRSLWSIQLFLLHFYPV